MADSKSGNTALAGSYDEVEGALRVLGTFEVGDVAIGGVEVKDGTTDTRAKVATTAAGIAESDPALGVHDAVLGVTTDAAVTTDATATVNARLRGLVNINKDALGASTDAAVSTSATGSISAKLRGLIVIALDVLGISTGAAVVTNATGSIQQYLRGLVTLWIAGLAAGEAHIGEIGGRTQQIRATFSRPGDGNAYAPNDAVSNSTSATTAMTFTSCARISGGSGYIIGAEVTHEVVSVTPRMRLHLYNATPGTVFNDNAQLANTYAIVGAASYLGYIDFDAMTTNAGTDFSKSQNDTVRKAFKCNADANLYGLLMTLDAFTPGNAKGFTVKLMVEQN